MSGNKFDTVQFRINVVWYRWSGYFGCQLESLERERFPIGHMRRILGHDMAVFQVRRKRCIWFRTTWAVQPCRPLDNHRARIDALADDLRKMLP